MRKVYHSDASSIGLSVSLIVSLAITGVVFAVIPFTHMIAKPGRQLELRKASVADLPPPVEEETPPPPTEEQRPPDAPPEPQLAEAPQQIQVSADLDVAVGGGGALEGYAQDRALTATESIQNEVFDMGELEKHPEAVSQVPPVYPPELRKARIEGRVTLVFVLGEDGRVQEPRVESSSRPEFEKPALDAIRKWRFRPGMKDGEPVRTYIRIPIRFNISSG